MIRNLYYPNREKTVCQLASKYLKLIFYEIDVEDSISYQTVANFFHLQNRAFPITIFITAGSFSMPGC